VTGIRRLAPALLSLGVASALCGCVASPSPPAPVVRRPAVAVAADRPAAAVEALLAGWVERGAFPGGVAAFGRRGGPTYVVPVGRLGREEGSPRVAAGTLYDLASLTKVLAATAMAMVLVDEGRLELDRPVRDLVPAFAGPGKDEVTVWHLLTHSSGLPAGAPLYRELRGREAFVEAIAGMELEYEPGSRSVYSDLGFILLGAALERAAGEPLESFVRRRVFAPLGMDGTTFLPGPELLPRIAPTEDDPWRGRVVRGEVHDENAWAMGGVAPHAGLFATAGDVARFARMALGGGELDGRRIVSPETLERFTRRAGIPNSDRAIGWDTKSAVGSSAGELFSPRSYGHLGFTGTSMWIDPEREVFAILLTNRVHPTRENAMIREVRPAFADAVAWALSEPADDAPASPERADTPSSRAASGARTERVASPPVVVGLERVARGEVAALAGKRLGLLVHRASVTAAGEHAVDVLRRRGLAVVRLFSPEHGLRGEAAAGEPVAGGVDGASGLPLVSLYGAKTAPSPADLAGLDALVVDLQDAGVRFYTYAGTMLLALEAAAEAGVEVVVLDRPNPLGGERLAGPAAAPRAEVPASLVNTVPGPLVHGLTLGEIARLAAADLPRPLRLTVVPMEGWERWMTWADTGRPWVPPSPNLRSAEAALAYPGTALLEATNVSEGRGTESPFLLLGAPWLDPDRLLGIAVPGFALEPAAFTPRGSVAAPRPKHAGVPCRGVRVRVTDPAAAEPYRLGLELLARLDADPDFEWLDDGRALTRLLGTPRVVAGLRAGTPVEGLLAADRLDHARWRRDRRPALLYPPGAGSAAAQGARRGHRQLAAQPAAKVSAEPASANQGHARLVAK